MSNEIDPVKLARFNKDSIFANTGYLKLWSAQLFSQTAVHMLYFITIITFYNVTQKSQAVSFLVLSFGLSALIFSLFAGIFVDHHKKKNVLFYSLILRFVIVLFFLSLTSNIWLGLALVFVFNAVTQFFFPAEGAAIPLLVDKNNLLTANSLYLISFYASQLIGYIIAGVFLEKYGFNATIIILAIMFLISSGMIKSIKFPAEDIAKMPNFENVWHKIINQISKGFIYVKKNKELEEAFYYLALSQMTIGMFVVLLPAYGASVLKLKTEETSTYLMAPLSVGIVIGAVVITALSKKVSQNRMVNISILIAVIGIFCLSLVKRLPFDKFNNAVSGMQQVQNVDCYLPFSINKILSFDLLILAVFLMAIIGFANALIVILNNTKLQSLTETSMRGRVYGVFQTISILCASIPVIFIGLFADKYGVNLMLAVISVFLLISHILVRIKYHKPVL